MYVDRVKNKYNLSETRSSKWNTLREALGTLANEINPRKIRQKKEWMR